MLEHHCLVQIAFVDGTRNALSSNKTNIHTNASTEEYGKNNISSKGMREGEKEIQIEAQYNHEGSTNVEIFSVFSFCFVFFCCFIIFSIFFLRLGKIHRRHINGPFSPLNQYLDFCFSFFLFRRYCFRFPISFRSSAFIFEVCDLDLLHHHHHLFHLLLFFNVCSLFVSGDL